MHPNPFSQSGDSGLHQVGQSLVDVSDIFYFFFCSREGKGESGATGWGRSVFELKIPGGGGGGFCRRGGGARGPGGCLPGIWGRGAKYFFPGPKCPPRESPPLPRIPPKHGEFLGDFLGEFLALPIIQKIHANKVHAKNPCKDQCKKSVHKNPCRMSVKEILAKISAEISAKHPCKTNLCEYFPHSNTAK